METTGAGGAAALRDGRCRDGGDGGNDDRRGGDAWRRSELDDGRVLEGRGGPEAGGVEAADGLVEGDDVAELRVVRGEGEDVGSRPEDVLDEALQRPLRADLDEDARAGVVERLEPLDELDGRGDLLREEVDDLRPDVAVRRVELAGDVGDDRDASAARSAGARAPP